MRPLELWGGHECTVNRVGDRWFDQTVRSGHQDRLDDLRRFAELGITSLRYPVLWERVSPDAPDVRDFAWSDERLGEIRRLGMSPIVGLIHHGSGPHWTHLLDDEGFAPGLAGHARAVAERYPWVEAYTPVNEPLTTARFACLYGHWYPHVRDEAALWRAVLNQVDATRLSMREVRRVNPVARLVQTDDLGHTHATPTSAGQAWFENQRRWITWDLLCGRVTPGHPLHEHIARFGLHDRLAAIADDPCPADVIGVNHYLTSERMLDEAVEAYPRELRPGPGDPPYVDVEAVRVAETNMVGLEALLVATWERYGAQVAVTESHNGCTRDEQMRWLLEGWRACERAREAGCEVVALTAWALLGSFDWDNLLRDQRGGYEPGPFDLRGGEPRATAVAGLVRSLARREPVGGVALASPGWWRRDIRFAYPRRVPDAAPPDPPRRSAPAAVTEAAPILIAQGEGPLGRAFANHCHHRGLPFVLADRERLRVEDEAAVRRLIGELAPCAVVNAAGWEGVDEAEARPDACRRVDVQGAENLARACAEVGAQLVTFSTDLVFDGDKHAPYVETDAPAPLNVYGASKAEAEARVLAGCERALVVRAAPLFAPQGQTGFAAQALATLSQGREFQAREDLFLSPTYAPDLVNEALDLLIDGETGVWHLATPGRVSWAEFARRLAEGARLDPALVRPVRARGRDRGAAPLPRDVALGSRRGRRLPALDAAIGRFVREHPAAERARGRTGRPPAELDTAA